MQATTLQRTARDERLTIGQVAEKTGCTVPTIRYYEEIGLLPPPQRRPGGYRVYTSAAVGLLGFIRQCRELEMPIDHIRSLIALSGSADQDCAAVRDIAQKRLDAVRIKLAELRRLEASLQSFVDSCSSSCNGGPATACSIFSDIAAPLAGSADANCCGPTP